MGCRVAAHAWDVLGHMHLDVPPHCTGVGLVYESLALNHLKSVFLVVVVVPLLSLCPTFCDPVGCSSPSFPVLHHLPELAQAHV